MLAARNKTKPYVRRTINMDDETHRQCQALAGDLSTSVSGMLRVLVRAAYEQKGKGLLPEIKIEKPLCVRLPNKEAPINSALRNKN